MPLPPPSSAPPPPPPPPSAPSDQTRARPQLRIQEAGTSYQDFGPISPRSESAELSFAGGILGGPKPGSSRKPTQPPQERTTGNIMKAALQRHRKGSADSVQLHESPSQQFAAPPPSIPFASAARTGTARSSISYVCSVLLSTL